MNYNDSINGLGLELDIALSGAEVPIPNFDNQKKFIILSGIQADIQSKWKPLLMEKEIYLKAGIREYNIALSNEEIQITEDSDDEIEIPPGYAIDSIKNIFPGKDCEKPLRKVSRVEMQELEGNEILSAWTLKQNATDSFIILIDWKPTNDYHVTNYPNNKLVISFYPRLRVWDSDAKNKYAELSDYDESNKTTYGGSWKLPSNWHPLIVQGACAKILKTKHSDLYKQWIMDCEVEDKKTNKKFVQSKPKYEMGISYSGKISNRRRRGG